MKCKKQGERKKRKEFIFPLIHLIERIKNEKTKIEGYRHLPFDLKKGKINRNIR